ncbi:hypothetical protein H6F77_06385 [Microcoleus sp. FACHB-831]|uniref:hypothetical protein n=1 Tax=Microcoleus sp. FACHB-831 TaxID=2692827 RepID=UPI00168617ED|nr:hypothetical protein [Microcoleus sp. FACHB-831]MBD1920710.1 hypothetical protein [Microcoleus sp. FACHB-831]
MKLNQYPAAIALAAQRVNEIDSQIASIHLLINRLEGNADKIAAFEVDLKNENQRKARRFDVLATNIEYQRSLDSLIQLNSEKANAVVHLEYMRNQFSVAKLEARLSLVQQLNDFETRELVGL